MMESWHMKRIREIKENIPEAFTCRCQQCSGCPIAVTKWGGFRGADLSRLYPSRSLRRVGKSKTRRTHSLLEIRGRCPGHKRAGDYGRQKSQHRKLPPMSVYGRLCGRRRQRDHPAAHYRKAFCPRLNPDSMTNPITVTLVVLVRQSDL